MVYNILVADDSRSMREAIKNVLVNAGFSVDTANDGEQALEMAKQFAYDMVLTDIYMPKKTGIVLVSELKQLELYCNKPILLITTEDSEMIKQKSKKLGASGWLTKPIDSTRLLTAVNKTFEKFENKK